MCDSLDIMNTGNCLQTYFTLLKLCYWFRFKFNFANISAQTDKECEAWVKGIWFLVEEAVNASYPLQIERWLRKEFYALENSQEK